MCPGCSGILSKSLQYIMKQVQLITILTVTVVFLLTGAFKISQAQPHHALLDGDVTHGGFGGPVVKIGDVAGSAGVWVGGRGGWIFNMSDRHAISLGGGGYGLVTEHLVRPVYPDNEPLAMNGYGGFEIEYTNRPYQLVHLTVSSLIGGGGVMLRDHHYNDVYDDMDRYFIFEPGLNAELNVTKFIRISVGASYRLTSGISRFGFRDSDFSGLNGVFTFKFGRF